MKLKLISCLFVLGSIFSFGAFADRGLHPADSDLCQGLEVPGFACDEDTEYVTIGNGSCGCLSSEDYIPAEICIRAYITCVDDKEFLSVLKEDIYVVGCGCF